VNRKHLVIFITSIVFSFHALAAQVAQTANSQNIKAISKAASDLQKEYKKAYDARKTRALKVGKIVRPQTSYSPNLKKLAPNCKSIVCKTKKLKNEAFKKFAEEKENLWSRTGQKASYWAQRLRGWGHSAKYWLAKNIMRDQRKLRNDLPTADGVYGQITTSGPRPLVQIRTVSPMVDDDGTVDHVVYDFGDGTSMDIPTNELDDYAQIYHVYPYPSHYVIQITLYDNDDGTTTYNSFVETSNNELPVPKFSVDVVSGSSPLTVTFTPEATDPEGQLQQGFWNFGDGSFENSDFSPTEHVFNDSGTYWVSFTATDQANSFAQTQAQIFVDDTPPMGGSVPSVIVVTTDLIGAAPLNVNFDASNSFDIGGDDIVSYQWDFGDYDFPDNNASGAIASHVFRRPGTYFARLEATDENGGQYDYYFQVFAEGIDVATPEIFAFQWDVDPLKVSFNSPTASHAPNALPDHVFWDFGDSNSTLEFNPSHTYGSADTYTVDMAVHDIHGVRQTATLDVTVGASVDKPIAHFDVDQYQPTVFNNVNFDATGSSDPSLSDPLSYIWDFGDGTHYVGTDTEEHAYGDRGMQAVSLIVTNSRGISDIFENLLFPMDEGQPFANIIYSPKVGHPSLAVDFDGSQSGSNGPPIVKYTWQYEDGSGPQVVDGATFSHTFESFGNHFVQLFVEDAVGNVAANAVKVIVYDGTSVPGGNHSPVATFSATPDMGDAYQYHFDPSGSSDADSDELVYEWKVNGVMQPSNGPDLWYHFPYSNIFQVQLTVYDQWGASDTYSQSIDISTVAAQQIVFDYSPIKPVAGSSIQFGAQNTIIPGSTIASYAWDFGDSSSGTGVSPTHTYSSAGTYTVGLTVTDSASHTFMTSQMVVVVSSTSSPTLRLSVQDSESLTDVTNSGTYTGTSFPETVHLSVIGTSNSNTFIKKATWDLGNGETAFGPDIEYTYKTPGTYNISVTGYDGNNASSSATATIVIPADCKRLEGETNCLAWVDLNDNILPFSHSSWTIQNTSNLSTASKHRPKGWIYLKALDGSDEAVDLSGVVSVTDDQITISREALVQKNINFRRAYKLMVETVSSSDAAIFAEWPILHFGAGRLDITTLEEDVQLIVTNPSAQFKKYISLGANEAVSLRDLPLGPTNIAAIKGDKSVSVNVDLKYNQVQSTTIDLDAMIPIRKLASAKHQKRVSPAEFMRRTMAWATQKDKVLPPKRGKRDLPDWTYDLCGNETPFNSAAPRAISENENPTWQFSSVEPSAQSSFQTIPYSMNKPVRLSCSIGSDDLSYGLYRWKFKDGPVRCGIDTKPHWFWNWFVKDRESHEDSVVAVKYEVQDDWTSEKYTNFLVFSASDLRRRQGRELAMLTQKTGLPINENVDWSLRQNYEIQIPPHFKRPKIRFELQADNSEENNNYYQVNCDVLDTDTSPKVIKIAPTAFNPSSGRVARNGQYSLQDRYNYFPIHYTNASGSAVDIDSDSGKAEYEVSIQYYNQNSITWDSVDVEFSYNGTTHTENYGFTGGGSTDTVNGIYKNTFTIDTSALSGIFAWQPREDNIQLKITPKGTDSESNPVIGKYFVKSYTALFDAPTAETDASVTLCGRGYFGESRSNFAQDILLRGLLIGTNEEVGYRCGNMSLPFGGTVDLSGLTQNTYQHGLAVQVRSFNDSDTHQDDYDDSAAADRKTDIDAYNTFSAAALTVSQIVDEYDGMSNPTDKKKIFDFCHPSMAPAKFPCHADTAFADIDYDAVLQICQWYSSSGSEIDGCPTGFMTNVIRYSKWVKQNVADLTTTKNSVLLRPGMASGAQWDNTVYKNYQKDAIVLGVWPDGKPIWDVSEGGTELTNKRITSCHESARGCDYLRDAFTNNDYYLSSLELLSGWR